MHRTAKIPLAMKTESFHQLGERITAAVVGNLRPGDREETASVLGGLCGLDTLYGAESWLGCALALNEGIDAVDKLAVVILDSHVYFLCFFLYAQYYTTNGNPAQLFFMMFLKFFIRCITSKNCICINVSYRNEIFRFGHADEFCIRASYSRLEFTSCRFPS